MKEILHQRMWETNSYKTYEDHMMLYEALEKSMNHDHTKELLKELAEACKKKKQSRDSPNTPPGSPPHQPPHTLPPAGQSRTSGSFGAFGSSQASTLASTYLPPPEDSLLAQTGDMAMFMDWFCKKQGILKLKPQDVEGPAFETVKVFHPNVIHLYKPLPLGGPPGQVTIQSNFFFNKDLEYLRYGRKGSRHALLISKIKAAYYPDVGFEQMVLICVTFYWNKFPKGHYSSSVSVGKRRPSLNKKKSVVDTKSISSVTNSKLIVNADLKCATCNGCLFSNNHDLCVLAYINCVNASLKSKSVPKPVNRKIWQPIGKMFTIVGHVWRPTGRTFTLVGNVCPLTRIATTAIVPLREPIPIESNTDKPVVTLVYSRKSKAAKKKVPVSNPKINKSLVVQIVLWYLDSGCSKHITGDRSQLINFVQKFLGTVKFGNDHVAKIMGYGDYKIGNVKFLRSKDEAPDFIIKFLKMIQVWLKAEAVATACYTQNRSIIRLRHEKTPYELLHNKLPDLSFLHVFGALCYPSNDSENLGRLQPKSDIGIFIGYALTKKAFRIYNRRKRRIVETIHVDFDELTEMASKQSSSGPALNEMTPATINSGLVQKSSSSTSYVPPSRNDWDLLFQPMFDELLNPPPTDSIGSPSLTTVDQDAPSLSKSHTTVETQSLVIPQDVKEDNLDIEVAHMRNDPLLGVPILEVTSAQSSSTVSPHSIVQPDHKIPQHIRKWTKDHPLQNIIGQLSRPVSTRLQLYEQALFCYYDAFLTSVEPKTYKEALT
nr:retrovirus-related Pol polyprotein from transposon TNT 1-94 [Tanacetum cinerariifolium]